MAQIKKIGAARERLQAEAAQQLRQMVLDVEMPDRLRSELVQEIDRRAASHREWIFVQMATGEYSWVGEWIRVNAARPLLSQALWIAVPSLLSPEGEILATRDELAQRFSTIPDTITRIMSELEGISAVRREGRGARARYFLSPRIATTLSGYEREQAQAEWPPIGSPPSRPPKGQRPRLVTA